MKFVSLLFPVSECKQNHLTISYNFDGEFSVSLLFKKWYGLINICFKMLIYRGHWNNNRKLILIEFTRIDHVWSKVLASDSIWIISSTPNIPRKPSD